jgi:hypothetical protein
VAGAVVAAELEVKSAIRLCSFHLEEQVEVARKLPLPYWTPLQVAPSLLSLEPEEPVVPAEIQRPVDQMGILAGNRSHKTQHRLSR